MPFTTLFRFLTRLARIVRTAAAPAAAAGLALAVAAAMTGIDANGFRVQRVHTHLEVAER